ncbi:hypothetical protein E1B28_011261 [Marasmius oreades]|uniref:NADH dehydrogenase [ubiquinone] 1 alpha subcomplex subunit 3 n=1 Tax=Marasmius oreades TaxID=181124 RepID=A0A9P7RTS1_9AGAR|nr:uncharacterized protein E1B28_011261 [Marasmius oreades]KAG7089594.1 hypothetical protein E1B28_011261 [Marasmius oreades]
MASLFSPFRRSYNFMFRMAHEKPAIFYSCVVGAIGPVLVAVVPPIRESFGYLPAEMPPTTYPLPKLPRRPVTGYDDE